MITLKTTRRTVGGLFAIAALAVSGHAQAQSPQTNTMTNIAVVQAGCDISAIGIDFGFVSSATGPVQAPTTTGNTSLGNTATMTTHSQKGADGGGDDDLQFSGALGTVLNASIGTVFNATADLLAGIYLACSVEPTDVYVTNAAGTRLDLVSGGVGLVTPVANSTLAGTLASATDTLDYSVGFTGAALGAPVGAFFASFLAAGTIGANQTVDAGEYTEVWTATVEF